MITTIIRLSSCLPPDLHQLQHLHPLAVRAAELSDDDRVALDDAHFMLQSWDDDVEDEVIGVPHQQRAQTDGGDDVPSQTGEFVRRGGAVGRGDEGADESEGAGKTGNRGWS